MNTSRRTFMKTLGAALLAVPFASVPFRSFAADKLAKEGEGMAKNLGYCADAGGKSCPKERKSKERADQFCRGCQMYTKDHGEGKDEVGKCMIIPEGLVKGGGWCKSWVKKPS